MSDTETIEIVGQSFRVRGGDGAAFEGRLEDLVGAVRREGLTGFDPEPLPKHNVLWCVKGGPITVCIVELDPDVRCMNWIAKDSEVPTGPTAKYETRQLATPYVVLKVPFHNGLINHRVELFYRAAPITSLNDELLWSNLLNVSPQAYGCRAWLCTQYLSHELALNCRGIAGGLHALLNHTFGLGGWNMSSDLSEGKSAFTLAGEMKVDPRVTDVDRWEEHSRKDPKFVLSVPWKPVGVTVGQLILDEFKAMRVDGKIDRADKLVNLLMSTSKPTQTAGA